MMYKIPDVVRWVFTKNRIIFPPFYRYEIVNDCITKDQKMRFVNFNKKMLSWIERARRFCWVEVGLVDEINFHFNLEMETLVIEEEVVNFTHDNKNGIIYDVHASTQTNIIMIDKSPISVQEYSIDIQFISVEENSSWKTLFTTTNISEFWLYLDHIIGELGGYKLNSIFDVINHADSMNVIEVLETEIKGIVGDDFFYDESIGDYTSIQVVLYDPEGEKFRLKMMQKFPTISPFLLSSQE